MGTFYEPYDPMKTIMHYGVKGMKWKNHTYVYNEKPTGNGFGSTVNTSVKKTKSNVREAAKRRKAFEAAWDAYKKDANAYVHKFDVTPEKKHARELELKSKIHDVKKTKHDIAEDFKKPLPKVGIDAMADKFIKKNKKNVKTIKKKKRKGPPVPPPMWNTWLD